MMHRVNFCFRVLVVAALIAAGITVPGRSAPNLTVVCSAITSNTDWAIGGSPYEICNAGIVVNFGATLTIDPGVTVQFDAGSGSKLYLNGGLVANGTSALPITITGTTATPGSWGGIQVWGNVGQIASLQMDNVVLDYGGNGAGTAGINADRANLSINHSVIRDGMGQGVILTANTVFDIHNTSFINNAFNALQVGEISSDLTMTGLSASGNGTNGVHLTGLSTIMHGKREWSNPGIPYIIDNAVSNQFGDFLTIDPGATLEFGASGVLGIAGELSALGTPDQPILMTGVSKTPGAWRGIQVIGGTNRAAAELDNATVEYGGNDINGANIEVSGAYLSVRHSIIRNSQKAGVRYDSNAIGSVLDSQIVSNGGYGMYVFQTSHAVNASNDYWGAANGPISDNPACTSGSGQKVTDAVLYMPFATAPGAASAFPLTAAPSLTLTPRRWYAPADNSTRVYFDITLRDGNGTPIPGRAVTISTTLGTKVDGGITDANGHTLAYLTSNTPGDATVFATLTPTACEEALSPDTKVTFTTPVNITDLFPDAQAPYVNKDLSVSPLPVTVGVNTTITAKLVNPLPQQITVDVSFGFVQSSIGLAFGPFKNYIGQVVPANSSITLTGSFVPLVSGHYCVDVSYTVTKVGLASVPQVQQSVDPDVPLNLNVYQPKTSNNDKPASLDKTRNSLKAVNHYVSATYRPNPFAVPLAVANQGIAWDLNNAEKISNALQGDPPRQDYTLVDTPHVLQLPHVVAHPPDISQARADALNALDDALAQANADGTAAAIALDRAGGATDAGNLQWSSVQTGVMQEYNRDMGAALVNAANAINNVIAVAASEGTTSVIMTESDVIAMQTDLATNGFTAQEISDAHTVGLSDADIAAIRQSIITANPQDLAGDIIIKMQGIRDSFSILAAVLQNPPTFNPGIVVSGAVMTPVAATVNSMAQVFDMETTIPLANPATSSSSAVTVVARRVDLPADWTVQVSPAALTLAPGSPPTTITVKVVAGSPVPQGSTPMVAIEGYAGGKLLGGVLVEVLVPGYFPYSGTLYRMYLPIMRK